MKRNAIIAALAVLVLVLAVRGCDKPEPTVVYRQSGDEFAHRVAQLATENESLKSRLTNALRARSIVHVDTLIRYDTIIPPPDTVLLAVTIDGDGRAEVDAGVKADSGYVPETRKLDVRDCDDGITIGTQGVVCDRARLGHLEVFASVGVSRETLTWEPQASAGFAWAPSYRSTLDVSAYIDTERRITVGIRKGVRIF